jgi:hypothetical protein
MASIENGTDRVVLKDGKMTLTLDKAAGKALLHRKALFWSSAPVEFPLADIADIAVKSEQLLIGAVAVHPEVQNLRVWQAALEKHLPGLRVSHLLAP